MKQVALILLALAGMAGCGGSASTVYDRAAYRACLQQDGAVTEAIPARGTLGPVGRRIPGAFGARLASGEYVLVYVAEDARAARIGAAWLERLPAAANATLDRAGNLVVATFRHPTAGAVKTLDDCKASAART